MKKTLVLTLAALVSLAFTGFAQMGGSPGASFDAELTKLFGNITAFTAKAQLRVLDKNQKEKMSLPMDFALLDGKLRTEVDMSKMKGMEMSPDQAAMLKQMGMERVISLTRPDKKAVYIVLPAVQACVSVPMPKAEAGGTGTESKLEKTVLGKETLDGHPCEKSKVIMTDGGGKREALVWNAADLKDFPIQIQTTEKGDTFFFRYKDIEFAKPDAQLFELPAGYTSYDSMQALTMGLMQKMMGGAGKP